MASGSNWIPCMDGDLSESPNLTRDLLRTVFQRTSLFFPQIKAQNLVKIVLTVVHAYAWFWTDEDTSIYHRITVFKKWLQAVDASRTDPIERFI